MKRPSAQPVQIASQNSAAQVITYIYQVRCNLVHGGKTPDSRRDRALCGASANVITALVEELL
jgi:hypothetical protein